MFLWLSCTLLLGDYMMCYEVWRGSSAMKTLAIVMNWYHEDGGGGGDDDVVDGDEDNDDDGEDCVNLNDPNPTKPKRDERSDIYCPPAVYWVGIGDTWGCRSDSSRRPLDRCTTRV